MNCVDCGKPAVCFEDTMKCLKFGFCWECAVRRFKPTTNPLKSSFRASNVWDKLYEAVEKKRVKP